jgi:hypothetical protein
MGSDVPKKTKRRWCAMKQLRTVAPEELISRAYYALLRARRNGRTTNRVQLRLRPWEIPQGVGLEWRTIQTTFGEVRLRCWFNREEGRWGATLIFPGEGFKLSDHVSDI